MRRLAQLSASFIGTPVAGMSPGWRGRVGADTPFAALALVQAGTTVFWGKAEVTAPSGFPVILHLHPLNHERTAVQLVLTFGSRMIGGASGSILAGPFPSVQVSDAPIRAGHAFRLCAFRLRPPCACYVFFLAASDVSTGRTGVWRPHKRLRGVFSQALELALFGARHGSYSRSVAAF
ncbi:MAG: hypothetical protein ACHQM4_11155 [Thermoanaerobaculia bacterium]